MGKIIEDKSLKDKYYIFEDRFDAGRKLAEFLLANNLKGNLVLAIPNGGVAIGFEVARKLGLELKVAIVRKATFPWTTEAGFGAVSWTGETLLNELAIRNLSREEIDLSVLKARKSVEERVRLFKDYVPVGKLGGSVILVDDGLATGYTMLVAVKSVKKLGAREIIAAIPTSSLDAAEIVSKYVDCLVVLNVRTSMLYAVADAYKHWRDLSELEALNLLLEFAKS